MGLFTQEILRQSAREGDTDKVIAAVPVISATQISEISGSVNEVDNVTQSNSVNAKESAASSEVLSAQAQVLHDLVGRLHEVVDGKSSV